MVNGYVDALGVEPGEVVQPDAPEGVAQVVAEADSSGKAVITWGGGTAQAYGYAPSRADVLLDLSRMGKVLAHEPGDMTVTVQPGARLKDVQAVLAEHGQFLPLDPPHAETATLGGIVATNAFGPSRVGYGTVRDWLIGLVVIDAQGRAVHGGGKVVKNVTGYDLPKLHVGGLGSLGVIVEATFKVAPKPESSAALLFDLSGADPAKAGGLLAGLAKRRVWPSLSLLNEEDGRRHLFLTWSGPTEVVEGEIAAAAELTGTVGVPVPHRLDPGAFAIEGPKNGQHVHLRFATKPADSWGLHQAVASIGVADAVRSDPYTGAVDASCPDPDAAALALDWAARSDAQVAVLAAPLAFRQRANVLLWRPLPPAFPLMRTLKSTLDPNGTLNPGRFIGRI